MNLQFINNPVKRVRSWETDPFSYKIGWRQFPVGSANLQIHIRGQLHEPLHRQPPSFLSVDVDTNATARIEGCGDIGPFHERNFFRRGACHPFAIDGQLQSKVTVRINAEKVTSLMIFFLIDNPAPVPGISLLRDPCFDSEGLGETWSIRCFADDACSAAVKLQTGTAGALNVSEIALDNIPGLASAIKGYLSRILI